MIDTSRFVAFEGIDGSGKSTMANLVRNWLLEQHLPVVTTREPGGTALGESIRSAILNSKEPLLPIQEAALFMVARKQLLTNVIEPALGKDAWVLVDRYRDSTWAYQTATDTKMGTELAVLEGSLGTSLKPGLVFYFDVDVDVALSRLDTNKLDYFESKGKAFYQSVVNRYRFFAKPGISSECTKYVTIDANQPLLAVQEQVLKEFAEYKNSLG